MSYVVVRNNHMVVSEIKDDGTVLYTFVHPNAEFSVFSSEEEARQIAEQIGSNAHVWSETDYDNGRGVLAASGHLNSDAELTESDLARLKSACLEALEKHPQHIRLPNTPAMRWMVFRRATMIDITLSTLPDDVADFRIEEAVGKIIDQR